MNKFINDMLDIIKNEFITLKTIDQFDYSKDETEFVRSIYN